MGNTSRKNVNGNFVLGERQEHCDDLTIKNGNLTLNGYATMLSKIILEDGSVSLGDFAFINELHMPYGGEIFFRGKRPLIRQLRATSLIVHLPKNCESWTDFVQINNAKNVIVRRDLD